MSEMTAYCPAALSKPLYEFKIAAPAARVTLPAPLWMIVQANPTGKPLAQVIVTAEPLVQLMILPLSAADNVRAVPASVMIPSGLKIKAGDVPGRKATLLSMIVPVD
jgi:hypothetical protein